MKLSSRQIISRPLAGISPAITPITINTIAIRVITRNLTGDRRNLPQVPDFQNSALVQTDRIRLHEIDSSDKMKMCRKQWGNGIIAGNFKENFIKSRHGAQIKK